MIFKQSNFIGMDMFKEWKREGYQTKLWNGVHQEKKRGRPKLTWVEGIKGLMGEKGLVEEDWNDRHNSRKKII
jgi:hypothetical protein